MKKRLPWTIFSIAILVSLSLWTYIIASKRQAEKPLSINPDGDKNIRTIRTRRVIIANQNLDPAIITLKLYDQVLWQNKDQVSYQISGESLGNRVINPGKSYVHTFKQVGTFEYSFDLYPKMKGKVIVTN